MPVTTPDSTQEASDAEKLHPKPLVSVVMITYNHADYLAQAIEGVVSQQCDFPFELVIGEDASKDETRAVAFEYQRRFPHIVRVLYSAHNVGMNANGKRTFDAARGEFVAFCEGDDYWCSPDKLARQVELIERGPDVGIVHTDWVRSTCGEQGWVVNWANSVHRRVPAALLEGRLFSTFHYPKILRTCTVLLRRSTVDACASSGLARREYKFSDVVLAAFVSSRWKVAYVPETMAVYRESPGSVLRSGKQARLAFLRSSLEFDTDARDFFRDREDYPSSYRWEVAVGLLLWAMSARDRGTALFALRDIREHFGLWSFIKEGWQTVWMRRRALGSRHFDKRPAATDVSGG
ncbi:MAG TPA: glycosyltransferase [Dyella sp.]|uniref:glycosyltransferase family 2 protein n=1 Tax=Dyella sp. TaxID=1869338 RepID=UPI002D795D34|nr:glycosyltransferase [Dyella sp.]HET6552826.1 glycosyltransferase [Dyella sp.]